MIYIFEYDLEENIVWFDERLLYFFRTTLNLSYDDAISFLEKMLEKYFKIKNLNCVEFFDLTFANL